MDSLGIGQFRVAVDNNRKFRPDETGIPPTESLREIQERDSISTAFTSSRTTFRSVEDRTTSRQVLNIFVTAWIGRPPMYLSATLACCPGGYPLAGWLMGFPTSSSSAEGLTWTAPRQNRWGAYFQDEWRATRKLTVNMGFRWDFFQVPHDVNRKWRSLRLDILTQVCGWPSIAYGRSGAELRL